MRTELRDWITVGSIIFMLSSHFIAVAAHHSPEACARLLPANITLTHDLEHVLGRIYRASPTFREQCDRIAATATLSVGVTIDSQIPRTCQAFTRFSRRGLSLNADVHLPPAGTQMPRLVGHEFEHIMEQIDGLNLRALARKPKSGVYESWPEMYETTRAQRAGLLVAAEEVAFRPAD